MIVILLTNTFFYLHYSIFRVSKEYFILLNLRFNESKVLFYRLVGVDSDEVPPVPMPNTEVKLIYAENTWLATARENR